VTSTSTTEALSANQGKELKTLVDGKQASDAQLTDVAGLAVTDGNFIVGNGSNFVAESAGTARTSLGLAIGTDVQAYNSTTVLDADILGDQTIYIPAAGMTARETSGAESGSAETSTNKIMIETMDFDTASDEYIQFSVRMPKGWNASTLTAAFTWSHAATSTNFGVAWGIQAVALVNDDGIDTAFGTAVVTTDTGGTTDDIYLSGDSTAITLSNTPAKSDWVVFQIFRDVSDSGDTMAVDARLHGISLFYTTDSATDD
jgi:hypothetical protein